MTRAAVSLLVVLLCCLAANATGTYYASPNSSNIISCTEEDPCSLSGALALAQDDSTVILQKGTYDDPSIFPIVMKNGIVLKGETPDGVTIDCGTNNTIVCLEIISPIDRNFDLTVQDVVFMNYNPKESHSHGELSALLLIHPHVSDNIPEFDLDQSIHFTSTSFFNNSASFDTGKEAWQYPAVVSIVGLPNSASVIFSNSVFSGNSIELFRCLYSSLSILSTTINQNNQAVANAYSSVLSAAIHPWLGGSNILIQDVLVASNDAFSNLIMISGVRCLNASYCAGLIIRQSNFQSNRAKNLIELYDGAGIEIFDSNITTNFITDKSIVYSHQAVTEGRLILQGSLFEDNNLAFGNTVNGMVEGSWSTQSVVDRCNFTSTASENAAIVVRGSLLISNSSFNSYDGVYVLEDSTVSISKCSFNGSGELLIAVGSSEDVAGTTVLSVKDSSFNVVDSKETPSTAISTSGYVNVLVSGSTFNDGRLVANCSLEGVTFSSLVQFIGEENDVKKNAGDLKDNAEGCQIVCNEANKDICKSVTIQDNTHGTKGMPIWLQVTLPIGFFFYGVVVIVIGVFFWIRARSSSASSLN